MARAMRVISWLMGVMLLAGFGPPAVAACLGLPKPMKASLLLARSEAGGIILASLGNRSEAPVDWLSSYHLTASCYVVPSGWQGQRLHFAINNHIPFSGDEKNIQYRFDLGVQILRLTLHTSEFSGEEVITSFRSERNNWFRNGVKSNSYSAKTKKLDLDLSDWNNAHDPLNVIEQNDRQLKGKFHASPDVRARSSFSERRWWRLNEKITEKYNFNLDNRLMSTLPASGVVAAGVPFDVKANGHDAIAVRYSSANVDIEGAVILCFANCKEIELLKLDKAGGDVLARLFGWMR